MLSVCWAAAGGNSPGQRFRQSKMLFCIRQRKAEPEVKRKKESRDRLHLSETSVNFRGFQELSFILISFWNGQILFMKNYAQSFVARIRPDCRLEI